MIEAVIDTLLQKLEHRGPLAPKVKLYSEATKAKFYQARWSLDVLREIEHAPNVEGNATSQNMWDKISINNKIVFFCECFWDYLRSSIDILAQIINELRGLGLDEDDVSFHAVKKKMNQPPMSTTLLFKALSSCERSWAFIQLNSYRHCSTHRRQVAIFELPSSPQPLTRVYEYMSGSTTCMNRYLCSNPSSLRPRPSLKRPVVAHNERILKEIEKRLSTIVNRLP